MGLTLEMLTAEAEAHGLMLVDKSLLVGVYSTHKLTQEDLIHFDMLRAEGRLDEMEARGRSLKQQMFACMYDKIAESGVLREQLTPSPVDKCQEYRMEIVFVRAPVEQPEAS